MTWLPWVPRWKLELALERIADRDARIAELVAVNEKLVAMSKESQAKSGTEEPEEKASRPHRKLGAQLREEFARDAAARHAATQAQQGVRK